MSKDPNHAADWFARQFKTPPDLLRALEITLHPRTADGGPYERHPGLGALADEITEER